jgi:hypothetical protein
MRGGPRGGLEHDRGWIIERAGAQWGDHEIRSRREIGARE